MNDSLTAIAFLIVTLAGDGSPLLRVVSSLKPISIQENAIISVSGAVVFKRTTEPLGAAVFEAEDIEFTKSVYTRPVSNFCSCREKPLAH